MASDNPLHSAVINRDIEIIKTILETGADVNAKNYCDKTLLYCAADSVKMEFTELPLKHRIDVKDRYSGCTPLHIAVKTEQEDVAKLLISYGADVNVKDETGKTPIFYAIENTDLKITKLLLTNRADIKHSPELLNVAVMKQSIEIVEALLLHNADIIASDKCGRTALHFTVLSESDFLPLYFLNRPNEDLDINIRVEIAKLLLSKGALVDAETTDGETTLHAAVHKGYEKVVETLLRYNANVNCRKTGDITPLHLSAKKGNEKINIMLLNKGADVNAKEEDGFTALHIAAHKEIVDQLLDRGAKVNSKSKNGITPLHRGAMNLHRGNKEIIETLLKFGADIDSRDDDGRTALHIASQNGHDEVVLTLLEYGSDINITSINDQTPLDHATVGIMSFYNPLKYSFDNDCYFDPARGVCSCEIVAEVLKHHIVKIKTAKLYVSEKNLLSISNSEEMSYFQGQCEEEIAIMKSEKINDLNISFYDILSKNTASLASCMRNENIVHVFKKDDFGTKFPIYASMIKSHFRKGTERKELLELADKILHLLVNEFPKLPFDCNEIVFSYLSNKDLRNFINVCKPLI